MTWLAPAAKEVISTNGVVTAPLVANASEGMASGRMRAIVAEMIVIIVMIAVLCSIFDIKIIIAYSHAFIRSMVVFLGRVFLGRVDV